MAFFSWPETVKSITEFAILILLTFTGTLLEASIIKCSREQFYRVRVAFWVKSTKLFSVHHLVCSATLNFTTVRFVMKRFKGIIGEEHVPTKNAKQSACNFHVNVFVGIQKDSISGLSHFVLLPVICLFNGYFISFSDRIRVFLEVQRK